MDSKFGTIANVDSILLKSGSIAPSWVISGRPQTRSGHHSASPDGGASTNVWDCTAGSFRWHYGWEETVIILEGGVRVTSPDGETRELKAGDVVLFKAGSTWTWEVETYVRKLAFHRKPASKIERAIQNLRQGTKTPSGLIKIAVATAAAIAASMAAIYAIQ